MLGMIDWMKRREITAHCDTFRLSDDRPTTETIKRETYQADITVTALYRSTRS